MHAGINFEMKTSASASSVGYSLKGRNGKTDTGSFRPGKIFWKRMSQDKNRLSNTLSPKPKRFDNRINTQPVDTEPLHFFGKIDDTVAIGVRFDDRHKTALWPNEPPKKSVITP